MAAAIEAFEAQRPRLLRLAYRMLGSVAEAEDVVQDTWLRWTKTEEDIRDPAGWLVRTARTSKRSASALAVRMRGASLIASGRVPITTRMRLREVISILAQGRGVARRKRETWAIALQEIRPRNWEFVTRYRLNSRRGSWMRR